MATTTNYSWTTPDDTALVKDGAAAIRTLGSSIDTTTKNLNPSTTLGDIEYRSSTANTNTRLAIGTTGQVLTVSGGVPVWAAPAGGGKVLQVVSATYATTTTIATETYTDTGLTASITPSSATSKILVLISQIGYNQRNGTESGMALRLVRGATTIRTCGPNGYEAGYFIGATANPVGVANIINLSHLDSPATTSSTTYKTQGVVYSTSGSGTSNFNSNNSTSSIILLEIGA